MAFNPALLVKLQPSTLFTDPATIPNVQPAEPAAQIWTYNSGADTLATVTTNGYFYYFGNNKTSDSLLYNNGQFFNIGDIIWAVCNGEFAWIQVISVNPVGTVVLTVDPASVNTAAIQDGAVTNPKLAADAVTNVKVAAGAAIAFSKLAALPSGDILVGSAGNVPTAVAVTGDITVNNAGVTAIGAGKVTKTMLAAGIQPSSMIVFSGTPTTVGGAAAEAFVVAGAVAATDHAFVQIVDNGTANVTALQAVVTANTLTVTFSGNPGNDCIFNYQIIRATA